ncbi:MAG: energy transducer TonB [Moraxellaceae bacterium]|nr:energy transducer TonB [Pseudobdellovibrionaceae bacterium]
MKNLFLSLFGFFLISCATQTPKGSIDKELVKDAIRSRAANYRQCFYTENEKNKTLEGKVIIFWEINELGNAQNLSVVKSTLNNSAVENCVVESLKTIQFPKPSKGIVSEVTYPFNFKK